MSEFPSVEALVINIKLHQNILDQKRQCIHKGLKLLRATDYQKAAGNKSKITVLYEEEIVPKR
jgi:hypothetical protein